MKISRHYLFAFVSAALLAGCMQMTEIVETKQVAVPAAQMAQIQGAVTRDFFDPETAMFRSVRMVDVRLATGEQERRVCGEVNGKNRMGGYVGYSMFGGVVQNGTFQQRDFFSACEPW